MICDKGGQVREQCEELMGEAVTSQNFLEQSEGKRKMQLSAR